MNFFKKTDFIRWGVGIAVVTAIMLFDRVLIGLLFLFLIVDSEALTIHMRVYQLEREKTAITIRTLLKIMEFHLLSHEYSRGNRPDGPGVGKHG